jgi:hypothetical protein
LKRNFLASGNLPIKNGHPIHDWIKRDAAADASFRYEPLAHATHAVLHKYDTKDAISICNQQVKHL